jgi:hypothetical protein
MNDMRARGVPCGRRWDSMWLVFLVHPNNTIVNQIRSDRGRVIMSWEVNEKIWGYKAVMFISKIKMNIVKIIGICLLSVFFRVNRISLNRIEMVLFLIKIVVGVVFQGFEVEMIRARGAMNQAKEKKVDDGSNTENRFIIIWDFSFG